MKMMLQQNAWDCLPNAACMLLNINLKDLYTMLGHNGSEIAFPHMKIPFNRRSFHMQEITDAAISLGKVFVEIIEEPHLAATGPEDAILAYPADVCKKRVKHYLDNYDALLLGENANGRHAVAWNHNEQIIYDPTGRKYALDKFSVWGIHILLELKNASTT